MQQEQQDQMSIRKGNSAEQDEAAISEMFYSKVCLLNGTV